MRIQHLPHLILLTTQTSLSTSLLILPNHLEQALTEPPPPNDIQISIIMPVLPPSDSSQTPSSSPNSQSPTLYDTLPLTRRINIFSSLLRDHPDMSRILSQSPQSTSQSTSQNQPSSNLNITILAPLNSAMQSLPHKPWESSADYQNLGERAYNGESGQERAQRNLRRFAEGHIVPRGAAEWGEGVRVETVAGGGRELWWESRQEGKEKKKVIMPDEVEVEGVESKAANGEVWILKGVLKI